MKRARKNVSGFSLIELVIVVVIIAIIGAIAIPKMSRGAQGAGDSALMQDLAILNSAADLFNAEHPAAVLGSTNTATAATLTFALQNYTDANGANPSATKTATSIYGPYIRTIPVLPVGTNKGANAITLTGPVGTGAMGWYFNGTTFQANLLADAADSDASGKFYNSY